ncbi:MAG: UDP-N-acetylmuramoyl-tripeptide--D-alanyl-D-alanine ligase [Gammaproteobacteria bacterium]|nr:UDP-N-acetylmuramoyl-tripeptide--D-alanyl-D-alanine ligase [Gammaproteobacteria bacterium]
MMSLQQAAKILNGDIRGTDCEFMRVSNDSRSIQAGDLYVALKGERFDGHRFIAEAGSKGAVAAMVESYQDVDLPQLKVADSHQALGQLAAAWRQLYAGVVVGITGSNGKTTVKEMTAAILQQKGKVLATKGNLNNDIGMPLTLLGLSADDDYAVIEMGANHRNEIDYLTQISRPDVALITNAGPAHLEGFGSLEGVAEAKGEIYSGLTESGTAIINADDEFADYWASLCADKKIVRFALEQAADVKGSWQANDEGGELSITTAQGSCKFQLKVPGRHNAMNALAACSAALAAGVELPYVEKALSSFRAVKGRLNIIQADSGVRFIDDTYNANPGSLKAGIEVLKALSGEHWLVLGDMGELGAQTKQLHYRAGQDARAMKVDKLLAIGENSQAAVKAFGEQGYFFSTQGELIAFIKQTLHENVNILIKGSRTMQMEKVVEALTEGAT